MTTDPLIHRLEATTQGRALTPAGQAAVDRDAAVIRDDAAQHRINLGDPDTFRAVVFGATAWAHLSSESMTEHRLRSAHPVMRSVWCREFTTRVLLVLLDRAHRNQGTTP